MTNNSKDKDLELEYLDNQSTEIGIGGFSKEKIDEERYKKKMERRNEIQQERIEKRNLEKGLIIVFTGQGKGKTTAALGMVLRTLGHGEKVAVVQFIKGNWELGEFKALQNFENSLRWHSFGEGFTWETQDRGKDQKLTDQTWEKAISYLSDANYKLVVLDEINIAIKLGYLSTKQVINGIKSRPNLTHVVLTGRGAKAEILDIADLVTEMKLVKHPFKEKGVKAQKGIEF